MLGRYLIGTVHLAGIAAFHYALVVFIAHQDVPRFSMTGDDDGLVPGGISDVANGLVEVDGRKLVHGGCSFTIDNIRKIQNISRS
jgi:hypothetical protein